MSMIVSLTTSRRLLADLAEIRKAGRVDELKRRCETARMGSRTPTIDYRQDAALLTSLMGHDYSAIFDLAAAEMQTGEMAVMRTIQQLAQECREGK